MGTTSTTEAPPSSIRMPMPASLQSPEMVQFLRHLQRVGREPVAADDQEADAGLPGQPKDSEDGFALLQLLQLYQLAHEGQGSDDLRTYMAKLHNAVEQAKKLPPVLRDWQSPLSFVISLMDGKFTPALKRLPWFSDVKLSAAGALHVFIEYGAEREWLAASQFKDTLTKLMPPHSAKMFWDVGRQSQLVLSHFEEAFRPGDIGYLTEDNKLVCLWVMACFGDAGAMLDYSSALERYAGRLKGLTAESFILGEVVEHLLALSDAWKMLSQPCIKPKSAQDQPLSSVVVAEALATHRLCLHSLHMGRPQSLVHNKTEYEVSSALPVSRRGHQGEAGEKQEATRIVISAPPDAVRERYRNLAAGVVVHRFSGPDDIWRIMSREFPWMSDANTALARAAAIAGKSRRGARLQPLLLVGGPGVGKSRWARRAAEVLGVPFHHQSLAGTNSSMGITGSERGWSNTTPGLLVKAMSTTNSANPLVLLDEVDKVDPGRHNGNAHDAIQPLLEVETAHNYRDYSLDLPVDGSLVSYVMTANEMAGIPQPLLNKLKVVQVGRPQEHHLDTILASIVEDIRKDWGLDENEMPSVAEDNPALTKLFRESGCNVRSLAAQVRETLSDKLWRPPGSTPLTVLNGGQPKHLQEARTPPELRLV